MRAFVTALPLAAPVVGLLVLRLLDRIERRLAADLSAAPAVPVAPEADLPPARSPRR